MNYINMYVKQYKHTIQLLYYFIFSLVEQADPDLRDKISFLVGKRLLQFQIY